MITFVGLGVSVIYYLTPLPSGGLGWAFWWTFPYTYPATPAHIIIYIGETPSSQMRRAERIGIQTVFQVIFADFASLNVGTAIRATTAGRMPAKMDFTIGRSLNCVKNIAIGRMIRKEGKAAPRQAAIEPFIFPIL